MNQNNAAHISALEDLRLGVEMDRHHLDDGDAKLAALDAALALLGAQKEAELVQYLRSKLRDPITGETTIGWLVKKDGRVSWDVWHHAAYELEDGQYAIRVRKT